LVPTTASSPPPAWSSGSPRRAPPRADIDLERRQQAADPAAELQELTDIYVRRGLDRELATTVATRLTVVDPLGAHLRDELGFSQAARARPVQAAVVSGTSFAVGAAAPLLVVLLASTAIRMTVIAAATLVLLAILGAIGGRLGGAPAAPGALRVAVGGGLAMAVTALIGRLVGAVGL
jgi:VIT1/CCC1 family predicted Fe2+/Mn2+ transporter